PPPAAFTLMATADAEAFVVVIAPPAFMVKPCAPAPSVLALMVMRLLPAPPRLALSPTASPLLTGMCAVPVGPAPVTSQVPGVLESKGVGPHVGGPSAVRSPRPPSCRRPPPNPVGAASVPAVVRMLAPAVPMPLAPEVGVARLTVPVAAVSKVPGAWVIETPVVFDPVFVATVIVPAEPAVML